MLHDPSVGESIRARVSALRPDSTRAWGKMTVDQMLWHCSVTLEAAMGRTPHAPQRFPVPKSVLKFIVLMAPWPKGSPTHPDFLAGERHDFQTERARCLSLIDEFVRMPLDSTAWAASPAFGKTSGKEWSQLHAKHLDHHLRQFSV